MLASAFLSARLPRTARAFPRAGLALVAAVALLIGGGSVGSAQPPAAEAEPAAGPQVPPLPDGTPEELLQFARGLRNPTEKPGSREAMMNYFREVSRVSVEAADRVLAAVPADGELAVEAARLKLDSLMMLGRLGDEQAETALTGFAEQLAKSPSPDLAREARQILLVNRARKVMATMASGAPGAAAGAGELIGEVVAALAANPDDGQTAQMAVQIASAFEHMPGGEAAAKQAYTALGPVLAKSSDERIRRMGESFAGNLRRLELPGNSIEITGTLLDGTPFDQKTLTGQVVLVDFWATWCGPCIAEIPNVLAEYEKYHDKGFEVVGVSLDTDREALEKFVEEKKIPWPILFEQNEGDGWQHPMATRYGISGIPTVILVGRDGKVVSLDVRGEKLGAALEKLLGPAAAGGSAGQDAG